MTIAAMKQALEALEHAGSEWKGKSNRYDRAASALRAAIAEQEKCEPACHATETVCSTCNNDFRKCVGFTHPAPVPAGWQLVPVEPTPEMIRASWDLAGVGLVEHGKRAYISIAYKAMLSAAPKPGEMK